MKTRKDVVTTIRHLLADLNANPNAWENPTLDRYLDSMAAWLEDSLLPGDLGQSFQTVSLS
jgi:hypothetical protein